MRSGVGDRIFEIRPDPTAAGARLLPGSMARSISARISARGGNARSFDNWCLSQASGASIWTKGGLGCLFLSLSDCCLKLPRRHRLCKLGGMAASDSFLQPERKITRRKRGKRIQHNVHRIGVAGEI